MDFFTDDTPIWLTLGLFHASEAPMILEAESQKFVIEEVQE